MFLLQKVEERVHLLILDVFGVNDYSRRLYHSLTPLMFLL